MEEILIVLFSCFKKGKSKNSKATELQDAAVVCSKTERCWFMEESVAKPR